MVWHLAAHLGSVRDLVDNSGNSVNHFVYDSFGNVVSQSGTVISRFLFTGREWDEEIGLQFNRGRFYKPPLDGSELKASVDSEETDGALLVASAIFSDLADCSSSRNSFLKLRSN